ncbi:GyrI-like domain-containing protein [Candidatus Bipolaricaulota bacterium]
MKFALKGAGILDFKVPNLECLWLSDPTDVPLDEWAWRLLVRVPDAITEGYIQEARNLLLKKKGIEASDLKLIRWEEGQAVQILHVGPYDEVGRSYQAIGEYAEANGLQPGSIGHEVYISDPRRTSPEKLKTIVRVPVTPI